MNSLICACATIRYASEAQNMHAGRWWPIHTASLCGTARSACRVGHAQRESIAGHVTSIRSTVGLRTCTLYWEPMFECTYTEHATRAPSSPRIRNEWDHGGRNTFLVNMRWRTELAWNQSTIRPLKNTQEHDANKCTSRPTCTSWNKTAALFVGNRQYFLLSSLVSAYIYLRNGYKYM